MNIENLEELKLMQTKEFDEDAIRPIFAALTAGHPVLAIGLIGAWLSQNTGNLQHGETEEDRERNGSGTDPELIYDDIATSSICNAYTKLKNKIVKARKEHRELMVDAACEYFEQPEKESEGSE